MTSKSDELFIEDVPEAPEALSRPFDADTKGEWQIHTHSIHIPLSYHIIHSTNPMLCHQHLKHSNTPGTNTHFSCHVYSISLNTIIETTEAEDEPAEDEFEDESMEEEDEVHISSPKIM